MLFALLTEIQPVLQEKGLLDALMQRYDERLQKFKIGESLLSFRLEDVAIILSLQCNGDGMVFNNRKTHSEFEEKIFSRSYEKHRDAIKKNSC